MDYLELSDDENTFYFDVQNLSIDHSLSFKEIEQYKDLIFSPNSLHQIYFKDKCDIKTILLIKNLLSISDYIDNFKVEKYILINLNENDYRIILDESYEYPSTWKIPYEIDNDNICLTDIPKIRIVDSFIEKIKGDLSPSEQIMKVYDIIKLFNYDRDNNYSFSDIIKYKTASSKGMNKLFCYILNKLHFNTFVGRIQSDDEDSYVSLVEINDKKYKINGIFLFDPSMDSLSKEKYNKEEVRRINYNFFGLNLMTMNRLKYKDKLLGILSILSIDDENYVIEKDEICNDNSIIKEKSKLLESFNMSFNEIYNKIKNTKQISIKKIADINDLLYPDKQEKYNDYLVANYNSRKEELFEKNTDEELKEIIDIIKK